VTGAPSIFTQAIADEICTRISLGESLISITKDKHMPCQAAVYNWLLKTEKHALFIEDYTRARQRQADSFFDEITEIARTPFMGNVITKTGDETTVRTEDMLGHRRLLIDALKWQAGKLRPKKYGDAIKLTGDKENPVAYEHTLADADAFTSTVIGLAAKAGKTDSN
jgi:hypothetical protein